MATRRKPAAKKRGSKKTARSTKASNRTMNDILMDLGRQYLNEGVREVLEEHGIDSAVRVELALTKPRKARKAAKAARKSAARRR